MNRILAAAAALAAAAILAIPGTASARPLTGHGKAHTYRALQPGVHTSLTYTAPTVGKHATAPGRAVAHVSAIIITNLNQIQASVVNQLQSVDLSKIKFIVGAPTAVDQTADIEMFATCPTGYAVRTGGVNASNGVVPTSETETGFQTINLTPLGWDAIVQYVGFGSGTAQIWVECEESQNTYTAGGHL